MCLQRWKGTNCAAGPPTWQTRQHTHQNLSERHRTFRPEPEDTLEKTSESQNPSPRHTRHLCIVTLRPRGQRLILHTHAPSAPAVALAREAAARAKLSEQTPRSRRRRLFGRSKCFIDFAVPSWSTGRIHPEAGTRVSTSPYDSEFAMKTLQKGGRQTPPAWKAQRPSESRNRRPLACPSRNLTPLEAAHS